MIVPKPAPYVYAGREKEYKRDWYLKNKERMLAACKERYHKNRDAILARIREVPITEQQRLKRKVYLANWYKNNKAKVLIHRKRRAESGKLKKYHKKWRDKNRGRVNAFWHRHRALKHAATVNLKSIKDWMHHIKSKPTSVCYYCQHTISTKRIHFDHIVPLSRGGAHSVENLCVSCQPCNNKKHAKSVSAFVVIGQQLLGL